MAVTTRAVRQQAPATNTTQPFTVEGFGTPQAAYFYWSLGGSADTDVDGVGFGHGFFDGTRSRSVCGMGADNVSAITGTRSGRTMRDDAVITVYDRYITETRTATAAWTTDGVTLTWANGTTHRPYVTCVLIKGANAVYAGTVTASADVDGTAVATASGTPDCVFMAMSMAGVNATAAGYNIGFGIAVNDGGGAPYPQFGVYTGETSSGGAVTNLATGATATYAVPSYNFSSQPNYEVTAWGSSQFTVTTRINAQSYNLIYLALDTGGSAELFQQTTITTTADWSPTLTSVGTPQSVLAYPTAFVSLESISSSGNQCAGSGFWYGNKSGEYFGHYIRADDNVDPSNTSSRITNKFIIQGQPGTTVLFSAAPTSISWTSTGFTIPGADVAEDTSARYFQGVAFTGAADSTYAVRVIRPRVGSIGQGNGFGMARF